MNTTDQITILNGLGFLDETSGKGIYYAAFHKIIARRAFVSVAHSYGSSRAEAIDKLYIDVKAWMWDSL